MTLPVSHAKASMTKKRLACTRESEGQLDCQTDRIARSTTFSPEARIVAFFGWRTDRGFAQKSPPNISTGVRDYGDVFPSS